MSTLRDSHGVLGQSWKIATRSIRAESRSRRVQGMPLFFFFSSRRRHTRFDCDWSSDVCSSDLSWRSGAAQTATWIASPPAPTVGDTIWLERAIAVPAGWQVRAGKLDATEAEIGRASCRERG